MSQVSVLLEFEASQPEAFRVFSAAAQSETEAVNLSESLLDPVAGFGIELEDEQTPVPMFSSPEEGDPMQALEAFAGPGTNKDMASATSVVSACVPRDRLEELQQHPAVRVWQNSELTLFATAPPAVDCMPFQPAVSTAEIATVLGVQEIWDEGHAGNDVVVGIIDEGVNGETYPVEGGFNRVGAQAPGTAKITSHGSMCAADVLVAAPKATLYDYPFLGVPRSGGALAMFQAVLEHRRIDGKPHLTNNSYGFTGVPPKEQFPNHEIWDLNHPLHRKIREVVASGAPTFFAAGNCGAECPSGNCDATGIGPGKSIHASNSLAEVITIAAVNSQGTRIGYSSQGPGMFEPQKPDLASYSHFFGNFGPGRPGGAEHAPFDNGTSAATPVACGVGALLLSAKPGATPARLKAALIEGARNAPAGGWDAEFGRGTLHAGQALAAL
jgi:serine protease AprX